MSNNVSNNTKPQCTVVIRCYNEERHIGRLLTGILQQSIRNVEIIVVDSGSTDATLSIASKYPVRILSIKPEEFSFGRSLNVGCQAARSEFIVIASAHVYPVHDKWLEQLLIPFADSQVALVYGKQRGNETTKYSERQIFAKWFPDKSNWHQDHPFCNNANAAIRRSMWQLLTYEETLTGLEDIDWAKRAMNRGYKIVYTADAEVVHVHNESPKRIYNRYRREAIALKRIFPEEKFTLWDFACLFTANVVSDCYYAWHDRVLVKNLFNILSYRLMQFLGTYRGFAQRGPVTSRLKQTFYYPKSMAHSRYRSPKPEHRRRIEYDNLIKKRDIDKYD